MEGRLSIMKPEALKEIIIISFIPYSVVKVSKSKSVISTKIFCICYFYVLKSNRHVHFLPRNLGNVAQDDVQDRIPNGREAKLTFFILLKGNQLEKLEAAKAV